MPRNTVSGKCARAPPDALRWIGPNNAASWVNRPVGLLPQLLTENLAAAGREIHDERDRKIDTTHAYPTTLLLILIEKCRIVKQLATNIEFVMRDSHDPALIPGNTVSACLYYAQYGSCAVCMQLKRGCGEVVRKR